MDFVLNDIVEISNDLHKKLTNISISINKIIRCIFASCENERLWDFYELSHEERKILELYEGALSNNFILRPDFLLQENLDPIVCEINARFPFNGLILNHLLQNEKKSLNDSLDSFLNRTLVFFDNRLPVYVLCESGFGKDLELITELSITWNFKFISPLDLKASDDDVFFENDRVEQVVFNLTIEELISTDTHILRLLSKIKVLNDPRFLILIHNRNLFCSIFDGCFDYGLSCLEKKFFVPTYKDINKLKSHKEVICKPISSGKGEGIYIQSGEYLNKNKSYVFQPFIEKTSFHQFHRNFKYVVGAFHIDFNGIIINPFFRVSNEKIVNIENRKTFFITSQVL